VRESVNLGKPKPGALSDRLGREKRIEHFAEDVIGNADSGVADAYDDLLLRRPTW
jgi:hypothetical protein